MRVRWRVHLVAILAYTLLALALTWPVAAHLGTHVPGNGADDPPLTWNLWWVRYSLLDLGQNPFDCDYLFYPLGINLAFYTLTLLNGLLAIPFQGTLGLIPTSNLLLLSSFVLSGYGAFLLAEYLLTERSRRQTRSLPFGSSVSMLPAFTAGLVYAFASSKLFYAALGQWNIASSQWIPFYILCLFKMADRPRGWHYPLLAALFLLLQAYAELTFASFLVLFTGLWATWHLAAVIRSRSTLRLAANLAVICALFAVGLLPVLSRMLPDLLSEAGIFAKGGGFADVFSADLVGFFVPTMLHPVLGKLVEHFSFDHSVGQHLYPGYVVVTLCIVGILYWTRRSRSSLAPGTTMTPEVGAEAEARRRYSSLVQFWSLSALVFWLLTLGPSLRVNGHDAGVPLPFALVARLPFFEGNRYPSRYGVLLTLSLAILAAFGVAALLGRLESSLLGRVPAGRGAPRLSLLTVRVASVALLLSILFEHLSVPLPLSDMRVPAVYAAIARETPGDSTLLDLPVAWRNGSRVTGTLDPIIMFEQYYQTVHGKRILAGNTSRNPPLKFQYFTEAPVINTLIALETGHTVGEEIIRQDRVLAPAVLRFFNIQTIVAHPAQAGSLVAPYVEATMPVSLLQESDGALAYRVDLPPWSGTWTVEPGSDLARLSYAEGWGVPAAGVVWAQSRAVRLLVPLDGRETVMAFRAYAPGTDQRMIVELNDEQCASIKLAGWTDYRLTLPASLVRPGLNQIVLRFKVLYSAPRMRLASRTIGRTGIDAPVNLVVQSAGLEVGDFGLISVDGRQVSPDIRGYNVVTIDPQSGVILRTASFDTHLDEGASHALAEFLNGVPAGTIVAVAAADEASRLLTQEAVDALHGIGAASDLLGKFRWGQAIVGVQGAAPGSAIEASDWMRPVSVTVGEGITEPFVAAAFSTVSLTAETQP